MLCSTQRERRTGLGIARLGIGARLVFQEGSVLAQQFDVCRIQLDRLFELPLGQFMLGTALLKQRGVVGAAVDVARVQLQCMFQQPSRSCNVPVRFLLQKRARACHRGARECLMRSAAPRSAQG